MVWGKEHFFNLTLFKYTHRSCILSLILLYGKNTISKVLFWQHLLNISFSRADHKPLGGLSTSRWLEALWEPSAGLFALPGGLDMLDISGDGDARFICADLGAVGSDSTKVYFLIMYKNHKYIKN